MTATQQTKVEAKPYYETHLWLHVIVTINGKWREELHLSPEEGMIPWGVDGSFGNGDSIQVWYYGAKVTGDNAALHLYNLSRDIRIGSGFAIDPTAEKKKVSLVINLPTFGVEEITRPPLEVEVEYDLIPFSQVPEYRLVGGCF